jgi:hypothetical protein
MAAIAGNAGLPVIAIPLAARRGPSEIRLLDRADIVLDLGTSVSPCERSTGWTRRSARAAHTLYVYFPGMNRRAAASHPNIHPNTLGYRFRQATRSPAST